MTELTIQAHIQEIETGTYYNVKLNSIPRIGELIHLSSYQEEKSLNYECVRVKHDLRDIPPPPETSHTDPIKANLDREIQKGFHFVTIYVKRSSNSLFSVE